MESDGVCISGWFFVSHGGEPRGRKSHGARGVEEIFVGGEGEPEFIGVRLGPFELSSALTHEGRDGPCWETFLGSDMGRKAI